jgi:hypothetical protein
MSKGYEGSIYENGGQNSDENVLFSRATPPDNQTSKGTNYRDDFCLTGRLLIKQSLSSEKDSRTS